jgi:hypothetical protein
LFSFKASSCLSVPCKIDCKASSTTILAMEEWCDSMLGYLVGSIDGRLTPRSVYTAFLYSSIFSRLWVAPIIVLEQCFKLVRASCIGLFSREGLEWNHWHWRSNLWALVWPSRWKPSQGFANLK